VALGCTQQLLQVSGSTTVGGVLAVNAATGGTGGLLTAANTNIGNFSRKVFGVVPEVGGTVGYDIFDWWRVFAGYNFLYWNSVARPGDQVNLNVNRNFLPIGNFGAPGTGPSQPALNFHSSSFYAHGVTLGMEFRY
jgi:hypothetical protein